MWELSFKRDDQTVLFPSSPPVRLMDTKNDSACYRRMVRRLTIRLDPYMATRVATPILIPEI